MTPPAWIALAAVIITVLVQTVLLVAWIVTERGTSRTNDARREEQIKALERRMDGFINTTNHSLSKLGDKVTVEVGRLTGILIAAGHGVDRRKGDAA